MHAGTELPTVLAAAYLADAENGRGHPVLNSGHAQLAEPHVTYRGLKHVHFDLVGVLPRGRAMVEDGIRSSCISRCSQHAAE